MTTMPDARRGTLHSLPEPWCAKLATPFAVLGIRTSETAITTIAFLPLGTRPAAPANRLAERAIGALDRYLEDPEAPLVLPVHPGGTGFQRRVWTAMTAIPPGRVRTYGDLAAMLGSSARAVGGACGANPIVVVIPCHRVVAAGGGLGGFMGHTDGDPMAIKTWLLRHERAI